jgi:hypothetical protein
MLKVMGLAAMELAVMGLAAVADCSALHVIPGHDGGGPAWPNLLRKD